MLLVILLILLLGGVPTWGFYSGSWGPPGIAGVILLVLLVYLLTGGR